MNCTGRRLPASPKVSLFCFQEEATFCKQRVGFEIISSQVFNERNGQKYANLRDVNWLTISARKK